MGIINKNPIRMVTTTTTCLLFILVYFNSKCVLVLNNEVHRVLVSTECFSTKSVVTLCDFPLKMSFMEVLQTRRMCYASRITSDILKYNQGVLLLSSELYNN